MVMLVLILLGDMKLEIQTRSDFLGHRRCFQMWEFSKQTKKWCIDVWSDSQNVELDAYLSTSQDFHLNVPESRKEKIMARLRK